ncbi:MAG: TonB-dependent receptor, partial [Alistipes sp.]|nr:TonB-dependent receptor [Candidatus Minthomonas equi]
MKRLISALILLTVTLCLHAQDNGKFDISGTVLDASNGEGVYMATAVIKELGLWTLTDDNGFFDIKGVPAGKFTFEFAILGYETVTRSFEIQKDIRTLKIKMSPSSLTLDEVVVTAEEGGEITSSSKISKQTIEHVQPSSLKDVMQLLPGNITENPNLTTMNAISIRDIGSNDANALGTAIVLDGASVSNDANLQVMSAGTAINAGEQNAVSSAGAGVDTRQIATDNIESVEVIRGIPSVVYGDLTSGAVVVKTKAGVTPWEVRLKTDPHLKQASAGKGFAIGEKGGTMNFEGDFAYAYNDIRTPSSAYKRFNFQVGYSNLFAKKLQFNVKLHGNWSDATNSSDPDLHLDEIARERDKGLRLNINGRWIINKPWITNIEYMASGDISDQYSRDRSYQASAGYTPTTTEISDHEGIGFFTQPQYYSDVEIFGRPINAQARITANLFGQYGRIRNKALIGAEWKTNGNTGSGKQFDPRCTPYPSASTAYRNRSYSDIPFLHRVTAYIEDNITLPIGSTSLEIQAGARFNHIWANGLNTSSFDCLEPRTNLKYTFLKQKKGLRELSIRGGWGMNYKMPSMIYLYPENAYKDMVSFNYTDFDASGYGMNLITTKVIETVNRSLRPQCSRNIEAGIEFDSKPVRGSVVYYNETMSDGYGFVTEFLRRVYNRSASAWKAGSHNSVGRLDEYYKSG